MNDAHEREGQPGHPIDRPSCELCKEIFVEQLAGWFTDTTTWPADRSFDVFVNWFEYQHHSMLIDLCEELLIRE